MIDSKREVDFHTAKALADKLNIPYVETRFKNVIFLLILLSAKENTNVEKAFGLLATNILKFGELNPKR